MTERMAPEEEYDLNTREVDRMHSQINEMLQAETAPGLDIAEIAALRTELAKMEMQAETYSHLRDPNNMNQQMADDCRLRAKEIRSQLGIAEE